ncbi:LptF/LptG family permease [Prochlorococcus sp. AH-716-A09]|nr:LptF/LptG family permease [Prochlorococcus sp. AH-716-A09]
MYKNIIKYSQNISRGIPIIDRWLLGQLVPPLLFAISAFTVVSLSVGVMFDLIRKIVEFGLPISLAIQVMFLKLPGFLVLSFPMSVLLSTLLAYGKLSANSEILALRSLGIKTSRLIFPALILSLFMTGLTFYFNNSLVPLTNNYSEALLRDGLGKSVSIERGHDIFFKGYGSYTDLKTNESTERNTFLNQIFFSRVVEDNVMKNVTVLDFSKLGYKQILSANQGVFDAKKSAWIFSDGRLITLDEDGRTTTIGFEKYVYPLGDGPLKVSKIPDDANKMTLNQAFAAKKLYEETGNAREARKISVRIQEKFTLPCACLVFGLIGSSLGSKPNLRSSKSQGFGLSVILILFYYILSFVSSSLGVKGTLTPFFSAWLPVFISFLAGFYLLQKAS